MIKKEFSMSYSFIKDHFIVAAVVIVVVVVVVAESSNFRHIFRLSIVT